ncbi:MAG: hypothetical protein FJW79_01660 [Actinobacteria bacterium]|nr:hypothetical protein [Actinomycetota bacterium]
MGRRLLLHLSLLAVVAAGLRLAVVPAEVCPEVTAAEAEAAVHEAAAWLARNQSEDGRYLYGYHRGRDEVSTEYNFVRHAGVTMSLYQYATFFEDAAVLAAANRGLDSMLDELIAHADWLAWRPPGHDVELGANALLTAALVFRRQAVGDGAHDAVLRGLGRFMLAQQQADGSMHGYWDPVAARTIPIPAKFATGEAAWALALLEGEFPGEGWTEAALVTLDYLALHRDRDEGYLTRMPDHWAAYALAEVGSGHLDEVRAGYARQLAGYFGIRLRFEAQRRGTGINLLLRWVPGTPAGVGTAGEGIGALWHLAQDESRMGDLLPNIEDRLACFAGMMVERQSTSLEAAAYPRPGLVQGAWFYRGFVQMDDVQHVLSGLLAARPLLQAREVTG